MSFNKSIVCRLIVISSMRFNLWTRWGRVGEPGQNSLGPGTDLETAKKEFKKKFSDKTKNKWENRDNFKPVPKKYTLIEMDDDSEGDDEEVILKCGL